MAGTGVWQACQRLIEHDEMRCSLDQSSWGQQLQQRAATPPCQQLQQQPPPQQQPYQAEQQQPHQRPYQQQLLSTPLYPHQQQQPCFGLGHHLHRTASAPPQQLQQAAAADDPPQQWPLPLASPFGAPQVQQQCFSDTDEPTPKLRRLQAEQQAAMQPWQQAVEAPPSQLAPLIERLELLTQQRSKQQLRCSAEESQHVALIQQQLSEQQRRCSVEESQRAALSQQRSEQRQRCSCAAAMQPLPQQGLPPGLGHQLSALQLQMEQQQKWAAAERQEWEARQQQGQAQQAQQAPLSQVQASQPQEQLQRCCQSCRQVLPPGLQPHAAPLRMDTQAPEAERQQQQRLHLEQRLPSAAAGAGPCGSAATTTATATTCQADEQVALDQVLLYAQELGLLRSPLGTLDSQPSWATCSTASPPPQLLSHQGSAERPVPPQELQQCAAVQQWVSQPSGTLGRKAGEPRWAQQAQQAQQPQQARPPVQQWACPLAPGQQQQQPPNPFSELQRQLAAQEAARQPRWQPGWGQLPPPQWSAAQQLQAASPPVPPPAVLPPGQQQQYSHQQVLLAHQRAEHEQWCLMATRVLQQQQQQP